ncbi:MAG TPA: tRNA pseudouridine(38-40) synthase TruA [Candidatus Binatia bacterium]
MNIKLTVEYDGTDYCGWQIQPTGKTVQGVLEKAISTLLGRATRITGSGRTDAGVHALGQVANFLSDKKLEPYRVQRALNALTPEDVTIKTVEIVPDAFDARRQGRSRIYEYRILNRSSPSPFHLRYAWHVHDSLDLAAMRQAITCLNGEHDFSSFRGAGCDAAHPVRTVYATSINRTGDVIVFTVEATAFLRHMMRNLIGTLVEVGRQQRSPQSFAGLLDACDRTQAGMKAPAQGLFLMEVKY